MPSISMVVPTYAGADPSHLIDALQSLAAQTRPPEELLIVADGALTPQLDSALASWLPTYMMSASVIRLPTNRGAWAARNAGIEAASSDLVGFLDADDLAANRRLEIQIAAVERLHADVVGSAMLEFSGSPDNVVGLRHFAEDPTAISHYMRRHNAINQSTVIARREALLAVGGYRDITGLEDYDLWVRLLLTGHRLVNLPEPLVLFRADPAMYQRRSGWALLRNELRLQREWMAQGFLLRREFLRNVMVRGTFYLLPPTIKRLVYNLRLRTAPSKPRHSN